MPYLWDWFRDSGRSGHIQSVILGGVLLLAALQVFVLGVIADLIATNREVTQRALERVRRVELQLGVPPTHYHHAPDLNGVSEMPGGPVEPGEAAEPVEPVERDRYGHYTPR